MISRLFTLSPDLFPVSEFQKCLNRALEQLAGQALTYMPGQGFEPLCKELAQFLAREGITAGVDDILVTSGSQQGIYCPSIELTTFSPKSFFHQLSHAWLNFSNPSSGERFNDCRENISKCYLSKK